MFQHSNVIISDKKYNFLCQYKLYTKSLDINKFLKNIKYNYLRYSKEYRRIWKIKEKKKKKKKEETSEKDTNYAMVML